MSHLAPWTSAITTAGQKETKMKKRINVWLLILLSSLIFVAAGLSNGYAAYGGYLYITGQTQGWIQGESTNASTTAWIVTDALATSVYIPLNDLNMPADNRVHRPIQFIKQFDKSTPRLFQALITNEILTNVTYRYYTNDGGVDRLLTEIILNNARLVNISGNVTVDLTTPKEILGFTFQTIIIKQYIYATDGSLLGIVQATDTLY
jgi:type VI secretion system secreted protein Hcp